jgi:hypothetical protein
MRQPDMGILSTKPSQDIYPTFHSFISVRVADLAGFFTLTPAESRSYYYYYYEVQENNL